MNIQIFGRSKCFDTKKAERWFKERGIRFQAVDVDKYGMSRGELESAARSVGLQNLVNEKAQGAELLRYLSPDSAVLDKLFENGKLIKTPVVRNGKIATVGYHPEIWSEWK